MFPVSLLSVRGDYQQNKQTVHRHLIQRKRNFRRKENHLFMLENACLFYLIRRKMDDVT